MFFSGIKLLGVATAFLCVGAVLPPPIPDWAKFKTPASVTVKGYSGDIMEASLSRDGQILFFNNRNDPPSKTDLRWATRIDDLNFQYKGLVSGANGPALDAVATMSVFNRFCFISTRDYAKTLGTVYCGIWSKEKLVGVTGQTDASLKIPGRVVFDIDLDKNGGELILTDGTFVNAAPLPIAADFKMARFSKGAYRLSAADTSLFAKVNSTALEYAPATSANGLELAFTRAQWVGKTLVTSVWIAQRAKNTAAYGAPIKIAAITGDFAEAPTFTPDGKALYFHRVVKGKYTLWRTER